MSPDIAGKQILQKYHSILYKLFGVIIDFVTEDDDALPLCPQDHFSPICRRIGNTECGTRLCNASNAEGTACRTTGRSLTYECHAGFTEITVPLFVNQRFVGYLTAGQILRKEPTETSFQEFRNKTPYLETDEQELRHLYFSAKVLTPEQIDALIELLELIGNYIVESESRLIFLKSATEKSPISAARRYIEENYRHPLSVADIAHHVYQSESYFSHRFKADTGVSPIQYLNHYRIDKAKELLAGTALHITDIALQTGFRNLTHFNRMFRKFEGTNPRDFRKKQEL